MASWLESVGLQPEDKTIMDNIEEVALAFYVIYIGTTVANFLLNTSRVVKAIELSKECVIYFNNTPLGKDTEVFKKLSIQIHWILLKGYCQIYRYTSAIECCEKLLELLHGFGDRSSKNREFEGSVSMIMAGLYQRQLSYKKAKELFERALSIKQETGNKSGVAACYRCLGVLFYHLGQYQNCKKFIEEAFRISNEIGDKQGIAICYNDLGKLFEALGQYDKATECNLQAHSMRLKKRNRNEIGDRLGEAVNDVILGKMVSLAEGEHAAGIDYVQKALEIYKEIGFRAGEVGCYNQLALCFHRLGEYAKEVQYLNKSLLIANEINSREDESTCHLNLGTAYLHLGENAKAKENIDKALEISKESGNLGQQFACHINLAWVMIYQANPEEAITPLLSSIQICEGLRRFVGDNDQFKVSLLDKNFYPYLLLSELFCKRGDHIKALYVLELGRARALTDLMSAQHFVGKKIIVDPQSWVGIERIVKKGSDYACLYISYFELNIFLWILNQNQSVRFRQIDENETVQTVGSVGNLDVFLRDHPFRDCRMLRQEHCEDRSLFPLVACSSSCQAQEDSVAALRLVEEDEDDQDQVPRPNLELLYKLFIAPAADLLDKPEILIVPDRSTFKIPFAALKDEKGKYLSESFRIRIVPSLTTLKLIQERLANQCSDSSVLIVGDPDVSYVSELSQLSFARKEAEMIARLLDVQPLLGCQATKLAVLEAIHSASLIHFAAHADAERGEIALAPVRPVNRILHQDDFLLKMSDVSEVQLTTKLVVLSCCHSGRGQIKAEGVVGIARAFLGSGARSVLVALWAIEDKATEQFMGRFYKHLVSGESASESLHQAIKWMRSNGFTEVRQWAPFMLIGDNVTFNLRK